MWTYAQNISKLLARKIQLPRSKDQGSFFFKILERNFREGVNFHCVIVGAHNGIDHDSLYQFLQKRNVSGIAIEPLPGIYEQLVKNLEPFPMLRPVNLAVHPTEKKVTLHHIDPKHLHELPAWASGTASLNKDHHKRSGLPDDYMTSTEVPAEHFMHIVKQFSIDRTPDLLQIDTEGFDFEILKQVDFEVLQPKIIRYEYFCLDKLDERSSIRLLKSKGYYCVYDDVDIVAVNLRRIKL